MRTAPPWRRSLPPCSADRPETSLWRGSVISREAFGSPDTGPWGFLLASGADTVRIPGEDDPAPDFAAVEKGRSGWGVIAANFRAELTGNRTLACVQRPPRQPALPLAFTEWAVAPPLTVPDRTPTPPPR